MAESLTALLLNGVLEHFSMPGRERPVGVSINARFLNTLISRLLKLSLLGGLVAPGSAHRRQRRLVKPVGGLMGLSS